VVSFTPLPLYPRERAPGTHCIGGWVVIYLTTVSEYYSDYIQVEWDVRINDEVQRIWKEAVKV
jgi:hypothetical protein